MADIKFAVSDKVVSAQIGQTGVEWSLAHRVAMDHPFQKQLVILAVAGLLEVEPAGLDLLAILTLAIGLAELPSAER